jgi:hypothetical protein
MSKMHPDTLAALLAAIRAEVLADPSGCGYAGKSAVCFAQGNVTAGGGGGTMTIDNTSIAIGQNGTVTNVTITVGGA